MKVGDKFKKPYPFHVVTSTQCSSISGGLEPVDWWARGCSIHDEQYDEGHGERFYTAHGEGVIEYEVLSIAEMPRKFQNRVIFTLAFTDPEGAIIKTNKAFMETESKFLRLINSEHSPFPKDYELEDD